MIPPPGSYRYEILGAVPTAAAAQIIAVEETHLTAASLEGSRTSNSGRYEVEARLGPDTAIVSITLRYTRGPFARAAAYRADGELMRGSVDALAGRNAVEAKLGRFREVDPDLILFKTLIIAHARARGQSRFTGRIVTIDPNTLVAASRKETYRQRDPAGLRWVCEPLLGESEEIELDQDGRITRRRDRRGIETVLREFRPER
jgi:hypothetical protein